MSDSEEQGLMVLCSKIAEFFEIPNSFRSDSALVDAGLDSMDIVELLQIMEECGGQNMNAINVSDSTTLDDVIFEFVQRGGNLESFMAELSAK